MGSLHVPRPVWARQAMLRRGRRGCAALAVAVLAALTLVNGAQHPAYGATEGPYGGTAAAVPGTVQAANYDTGGQGVAYNVASANGSANSYRSDGVDLESTADTAGTSAAGGAYDIGWTTPGQWFNYTVNVATAGTYTVAFRVSSPYGITDALHIANSSGASLTGAVAVPNTGGYETWTTVDASITLPAGQQTLTVNQDSNGWNFHYMTFTLNSGGGGGGSSGDQPFGGTPAAVPGTVQVANYDTGGSGVAYKVAATNGTANSYRSDGVDLESTADTADTSAAGGAYDMGWTTPGQWFNYTVEVATAGVYTVTFRVASPYGVTDALHIANSSGANLTGAVAVPNTGGYQTWATVTASITLPAGQQTLTVDQDSNGWNFHYLAFTQGSGGGGGGAPARPSTAARRTSRWTSRPRPPRPRTPPTTRRPTLPTAIPAAAGPARPATRSGWRSTSAPSSRYAAWASSGRRRTPPGSRSRCPATTRPGPRSTPRRPAPAGTRRSPSR